MNPVDKHGMLAEYWCAGCGAKLRKLREATNSRPAKFESHWKKVPGTKWDYAFDCPSR